ncbi:MAG: prepilin-type N-terminal cleavage/methylation domain-containing protein [Candidatus Eisenbacteria bacterium]|nr:prepilin-type N-terminal cleavage/methylation domain-containing protein [Candidatus Eisenbacteria bacterium]
MPLSGRTSRRGFTLVELMVAIIILSMMAAGLYEILHRTRESYDTQRWVLEMQDNCRVALQTIADDFRHVSYGKDPTQPSIGYAGPDSVAFVADLRAESGGAESISYYLSPDGDPDTPNPNDTVLMKTVTDSTGAVLYSAPQAYGMATDGLQFRYFNGQGVELSNPVPSPEQIGEIEVLVKTMTRRSEDDGTYQDMTLSTTIYPRNLPLSPARSRPSTPACGPLSYPDCESVTQVWETPTTNTDGSELDFNDISHFNVYLGTDPDDLDLYCRLARTFNEWTISALDPALTYYLAVTCVSRSGVESHPCMQTVDLGSSLSPQIPQNAGAQFPAGLDGVRIVWDQVTEFEGGGQITTPVTYHVYRDSIPGFTPDPDNLLASVQAVTQYEDTTLVNCEQYFFRVTAEACGGEGDPTLDIPASIPSPPSCPQSFTGNVTDVPGVAELFWTAPTTRMDGSQLDPAEIGGYIVVYDTIPGGASQELDVPDGSATSTTVSGLELCQDYYFNILAYDLCPGIGDICGAQELHLHTAQPCDPVIPTVPGGLALVALDDRLNLSWDANQVDCDLYGYKIYYGVTSGGPYDGTGALEGDSPVTVSREEVTVGGSCTFTLNGMSECQSYYVVVSCIDKCEPPNESPMSSEASGETDCTPCQLDAGCTAWHASEPSSFQNVHLEVFTEQSVSETLTELTPTWSLSHTLREVWIGRPLAKIWDEDGSAGEDGPIGPQPSGAVLNIDDTDVAGWTSAGDGEPLMLIFDGDMRGDAMQMEFHSFGNTCSADNTVDEGLVFENFDDGVANGWSYVSGSWSVTSGLIYQSYYSGTAIAYDTNSWCSDFIYTTKLNVVYSQTPYIMIRAQDTSNYYLVGLKTYDNIVRIGRILNGNWDLLAYTSVGLNNNTWYNLTVRAEGTQLDVYLDCQLVLSHNQADMWTSGYLGLRTYRTRAYYDDVQAVKLTPPGS